MGKKVKTGKSRLDKYYHLAKEQGYRARSAFKLIQLTQRNDIFSGCRALLDLCAAPGGWLQVAQKNMPIASKIVGVDLAPIKPIHGVTTIQGDITTQRCRALLKKEFEDVDVDVVLHDGAPNVGTSWGHDAYAQNELVLHATKLACEFLRSGGTYITKVFRSQDYVSLLWVFQQLFARVVATKPSSSRNVSAEIFVLCSGYKKPPKLDPRFFDPRHVFINAELPNAADGRGPTSQAPPKRNLSELMKDMTQKRRDGYNEGDDYRETSVTAYFQTSTSPAEFLVSHHKLTFPESDQEAQRIKLHPSTTEEILQCCADLKVLGKREYSLLIKWRTRLLKAWALEARQTPMDIDEDQDIDKENTLVADSEAEELEKEAEWQKQLEALKLAVDKKSLKEKRKLREKLKKLRFQRQMSLGAFDAVDEDPELFSLKCSKALQEEDTVLEQSGLLQDVERLDVLSDVEEEEVSDQQEDDEADDAWMNDDTKRLERMAEDLDIWAKETKQRAREKEAKRLLKKKKETRRQQAFAAWNHELAIEAQKLDAASRNIRHDDDDNEDDQDDDGIPEPTEFRIRDDSEDDEESKDLSARVKTNKTDDSDPDSCGDEKDDDVCDDACSEDHDGHSLAAIRASRWYNQPLFKDAGITFDDLQREDGKISALNGVNRQASSMDVDHEIIPELSDSELPPMPLTDKQKRKEKRRRELERKKKTEASKCVKFAQNGLGELEDDDDTVTHKDVGSSTSKATSTFTVLPACPPCPPKSFIEDATDDELDVSNQESSSTAYRPKSAQEIAEVQALGSLLARKRTRFDLIDGAYNRYAFDDDEGVPEWFLEDEAERMRPELPVTKEMMKEYRAKLKELSQRPIRKVAEAAGRKKLRLKKCLAKVKKQAETIASSSEYSEPSKTASIRKLVKKASRDTVKPKMYIASRKAGGGALVGGRGNKGEGTSGAYRVVDKRLKKDKRGKKNAERRARRPKRRH